MLNYFTLFCLFTNLQLLGYFKFTFHSSLKKKIRPFPSQDIQLLFCLLVYIINFLLSNDNIRIQHKCMCDRKNEHLRNLFCPLIMIALHLQMILWLYIVTCVACGAAVIMQMRQQSGKYSWMGVLWYSHSSLSCILCTHAWEHPAQSAIVPKV